VTSFEKEQYKKISNFQKISYKFFKEEYDKISVKLVGNPTSYENIKQIISNLAIKDLQVYLQFMQISEP